MKRVKEVFVRGRKIRGNAGELKEKEGETGRGEGGEGVIVRRLFLDRVAKFRRRAHHIKRRGLKKNKKGGDK